MQFAVQNHYIVKDFLNTKKLPEDDWYDVVIFRYLRSVVRYVRFEELHQYKFKTIAYQAMRSAVGNEYKKRKQLIQTVSLETEIPDTDGVTLMDMVTYENLNYVKYEGV